MYQMAIELLGQGDPSRVMLVAAHNYDLTHARKHGMATAFILRLDEYGPNQETDLEAEQDWDVSVNSAVELAAALGC